MIQIQISTNYIGEFVAYDPDRYDGPENSIVGVGKTIQDAIDDFIDSFETFNYPILTYKWK